jgi:hypothetical protein
MLIFSMQISCSNNISKSKIFLSECELSKVKKVNISALLRIPREYNNEYVEVTGYYEGGFEKSLLFESSFTNEKSISISVFLPEPQTLYLKTNKNITWNNEFAKSMDGKKVKIIGNFDYGDNYTIFDNCVGKLSNICYIEIWSD